MKLERIAGGAPGQLVAGEKQLFAPAPLRTIAMNLSGLQFRVLLCVCAHDRLSLVTGKGQGCRASNERMRRMIGCNYSRLCSTLTHLVELGLLERENLGRHTVYRVVYTEEDRLLFSNMTAPSIGCQTVSDVGSISCRHFPESGANAPKTPSQYIPLNGRNRFSETGEDSSSEDARFAARHALGGIQDLGIGGGKIRHKAGLPKTEFADNAGGQLARLERAISAGEVIDRLAWYHRLEGIIGDEDPANSGRASRLADRLVDGMTDAEYRRLEVGNDG